MAAMATISRRSSFAESYMANVLELGGMNIEDSEEYDTDLDIKETFKKKVPIEETSIDIYQKTCARLKLPISRVFVQDLDSPEINISHRNLGPKPIKALATALVSNTRVQRLILKDIGLGGDGAIPLADMLCENCYITKLNLASNDLGTKGAFVLAGVMKWNKGIVSMNLADNNFDDDAAQFLAHAIQTNDYMVELNISKNAFGEKGAVNLAKGLVENRVLEILDLSWNNIRTIGAVALCKALQLNNSLTHVNLAWNGLGYEGALAIRDLLKENETIQELDVSNNRINWDGALFISQGIQNNKTLEVLKLGYNPLTTTGCMDLIDSIGQNRCKLKFLDLSGVVVVPDFDFMALAIKQTKEFDCVHGGQVSTHDVLGQRHGKKIDPMQKLINYMKDNELRPHELFRSFDKQVSNKMSKGDFVHRMKMAGINIPKHEIIELLQKFRDSQGKGSNGVIDYKKMIFSVKEQNEKERLQKIREQKRIKSLQTYHKTILTKATLPPIKDEEGTRPSSAMSNGMFSLKRSVSFGSMSGVGSIAGGPGTKSMVSLNSSRGVEMSGLNALESDSKPTVSLGALSMDALQSSSDGPRKGALMSMSTKLGGKVKEFGKADAKKKRKKKKKKCTKT